MPAPKGEYGHQCDVNVCIQQHCARELCSVALGQEKHTRYILHLLLFPMCFVLLLCFCLCYLPVIFLKCNGLQETVHFLLLFVCSWHNIFSGIIWSRQRSTSALLGTLVALFGTLVALLGTLVAVVYISVGY